MVDLERHSVVDVLDDRSVESAKSWLQERPAMEVISRDRCGMYAQAAREGAPQARQVADRFHLVRNLREAIKEQMSVYGHANVRLILSEDAIASTMSQQRRARLGTGDLVKKYSTRFKRCGGRASTTLEQRSSRRADQPPQDAEASGKIRATG
ncbi:ISL3 family insertion sequence transposase domain-containing protein (plasmid) [Rhizobium etli 8C-3]|uniref:Transposase n=2 Tax=Rhizobium TaxID=379 RepID=A0A4V2VCY6_9HYPH|nr:ISL3 family insertion sequence transposase domain-containing protein [Rhizobium etli 8C-3]TCU30605.1 transposase [Rhizobium azibense]TCU41384.1 transposase [Rhizobium azibense]